jgi:hypothetical protein
MSNDDTRPVATHNLAQTILVWALIVVAPLAGLLILACTPKEWNDDVGP